jgi:biopolymer transport protein ExbD
MSWKIRHQGSPRSIEGLALPQVVEGLQEGLWEPTDEVMGPDDGAWQPIENHPALAEVALDIEPAPAKPHEDETRLDMNPLIDVALVLLIFFILTTSYAVLQRVIDLPGGTLKKAKSQLRRVSPEQVKEVMIRVEARKGPDGKPLIKVEDETVEMPYLRATLEKYVKSTRKTSLLLKAQGVDLGTVVAIQDAAKGAHMDRVFIPDRQGAAAVEGK